VRLGLVTYWFNRGQGTVGRQLRGVLDRLGHETVVLARPTKAGFHRPGFVDRGDVWRQPGVTAASSFAIPRDEYVAWALEHRLDGAFFFQNYQFDEVAELRRRGVRTIGAFMWEAFRPEHVAGALRAYDVVYAFTPEEQRRYRDLGIEAPIVPWGCHPELLPLRGHRGPDGTVIFFFPGGYLSRRKPLMETVEAFEMVDDPRLRLVVKTQGVQEGLRPAAALIGERPRIRVVDGDLSTAEHHALMASADVCLAPSRWEGLGLHLYEATALGLPIITNDQPPMRHVVVDGENGALVRSVAVEPAPSGIPAYDPDPDSLEAAIRRLADDGVRGRLTAGAIATAEDRLAWRHTVEGVRALLYSSR
jgi:glycosyltransferase involved in cell wall biosynthesis